MIKLLTAVGSPGRHSLDPLEYAVALRLLSRDVQITGAWINGFETSKIKRDKASTLKPGMIEIMLNRGEVLL